MKSFHQGLIAAGLTPMSEDGSVNEVAIAPLVEHLLAQKINGFYVCGSTGEGVSLTTSERKSVAEAYVNTVAGRVPVLVQVGHNSLSDAVDLATHAAAIGATAVSATCPSYFKVSTVEDLSACMEKIARAVPDLPFYYYHIPSLTGSVLSMPAFLTLAAERMDNLAGLKFTTPELHEYMLCSSLQNGRFEVMWGTDEMLLPALASGVQAAIGSTYNVAPALYNKIIDAFNSGNLDEARQLQTLSAQMIAVLKRYPFHAALKICLQMSHLELGPCRLPLQSLAPQQAQELREQLDQLGFRKWATE